MSRTPTRPAPGRPPDAALDAAILRETLAVLAEAGYERLSVEAVARRAGTAKTSVYRRWPTKDALVLAALRGYLARPEPAPPAASKAQPGGTLRADLLAHARRLAALLTPERAAVFAGLLLAMRTNPALAAAVRAQLVERELGAMTAILERAAQRGEAGGGPPVALFAQVLPSLLFTRLVVLDAPVDDRFLTMVVDEVLVPLLGAARRPRPRRRRATPPRP